MSAFACWLFLLPLGICLGLALFRSPRRSEHHHRRPWQPSILWLSDDLKSRLGKCGLPEHLQNQSLACIYRLLDKALRGTEIQKPLDWQVATWPEQSRLLFSGDLKGLKRFQEPFLECDPHDDSDSRDQDHSFRFRYTLAIAMFLLSVALLVWSLITDCWCDRPPTREEPIANSPPARLTLSFSSDLFFEFADSSVPAPLEKLFHKRITDVVGSSPVEIMSVKGYADPIGTLCVNEKIANGRAQTAANLLGKLNIPFSNGSAIGIGTHPDNELWDYCLKQHMPQDGGEKPLILMRPGQAKDCPRQTTDWYRRNSFGTERKTVLKSESKIISCLSALRRVDVELKFTTEGKGN